MKFHLISDNMDTYIGMRLAGVEGTVVREAEEVRQALEDVCADPDIAVVLITARLVELCRETVYHIKSTTSRPLIVEVADRHGDGNVGDSITRYVREAVGIKL